MNKEQKQEVYDRWTAMFGFPIPGSSMATWADYLGGLTSMDALHGVIGVIDKLAAEYADKGEFAKKPGLSHVKAGYRKHKKAGRVIQHREGCNACNKTGLTYIVMADDNTRSRLRPIRRFIIQPSPRAYVLTIPCICDKGLLVNEAFEIANIQHKYTPQQLRSLAADFTYTHLNVDKTKNIPPEYVAMDWRKSCEEWYWKRKIKINHLQTCEGRLNVYALPEDMVNSIYNLVIDGKKCRYPRMVSGKEFTRLEEERALVTEDPNPVLEYVSTDTVNQAIAINARGEEVNGFLPIERNYNPEG